MNICFFNLPESSGAAMTGGIERVSSLLAIELRRRGHHVEFYYEPPRYFYIPLISALFPSLFNPSARARFDKFVEEHKIDVAVWHWPSFYILFPLKNLPCRLITVWHSVPFWGEIFCTSKIIGKFKLRSRLAKRIVQLKPCRFLLCKFFKTYHSRFFSYVVRHSDKFVLLSEGFIPEFPLSKKFPEKVCAIPNIASFEVQGIDFSSKKKELLWVGRMAFGHKRPDFMLQIWQRLQDRFPDWSLRFVGDGPYLPELKALAKELGVQRVSFEGYQNPIPYYRSAPIYCMTSTFEGFGLTLVEAQAYGCIPVAFEALGPFRDIIDDGIDGVLVPAFDLDAYAGKLAELMSDSELREHLARNGQKSVTKFSSEAIGDKWEKFLQEVVGENP